MAKKKNKPNGDKKSKSPYVDKNIPLKNNGIPSPDLENGINEEEAISILSNILKNNLKRTQSNRQEVMSDYANLISILSEWLDCFIVVGYDLKGDGVFLSNPKTVKDQNSLTELLKKVFIDLMSK